MLLTSGDVDHIAQELRTLALGATFQKCFAIEHKALRNLPLAYTQSSLWALRCDSKPTNHLSLLISLKPVYAYVGLLDQPLPLTSAKDDPWSIGCHKFLQKAVLQEITTYPGERILILKWQKPDHSVIYLEISLIPHKPMAQLWYHDHTVANIGIKPKLSTSYTQWARTTAPKSPSQPWDQLPWPTLTNIWHTHTLKDLLERIVQKIETLWKKEFKRWHEQYQSATQLLQTTASNTSLYSEKAFALQAWTLTLQQQAIDLHTPIQKYYQRLEEILHDPHLMEALSCNLSWSWMEHMEHFFQKAKKSKTQHHYETLRFAEATHAQERLKEHYAKWQQQDHLQQNVHTLALWESIAFWLTWFDPENSRIALPPQNDAPSSQRLGIFFRSDADSVIGVGRSEAENHYLSFTWGSGNDTWVHLLGLPSAHAVIKTPKKNLTSWNWQAIFDAAHLLAHFQPKRRHIKHQSQWQVQVARCKHVRKQKKSSQVWVTESKNVWVRQEPKRFERLLGEKEKYLK